MKTYIGFAIVLFVILACCAAMIAGCGHGNDDFSDLENIIKDDREGIFGIELADDDEAQGVAEAQIAREYTLLGKSYRVSAGISHAARLFGRTEVRFRREIQIARVNDTLAVATIRHRMTGNFVVIEMDGTSRSKAFEHLLDRTITFAERENPATGESWTPISFSAAYGSSPNSQSKLDSLKILTRLGSVAVSDPLTLNFTRTTLYRLLRLDTIRVEVQAVKTGQPADSLFGTIVTGKNRSKDGRFRIRLLPVSDNRFVTTIRVGLLQPLGINQLGIDFYTASTIMHPLASYDSFMILVPYEVREP